MSVGVGDFARAVCRLLLGVLLACSGQAGASAGTRTGTTEALPGLSAAALAHAVELGRTIRKHRVLGADVAAVLSRKRAGQPCQSPAALVLESSIIEGSVTMQVAPAVRRSASGDAADAGEDDSGARETRGRVVIPVSIRDTTVMGDMQLNGLSFACPLDLSRSRFEGQFRAMGAEISTLLADATIFRREVSLQSVHWLGPASFRGAEFKHNAEFMNVQRGAQEGASFKDVDFEEVVFGRFANFIGVHFDGATSFRLARFSAETNFSQAHIARGPKSKLTGPFYQTEFLGRATFRNAKLNNTKFFRTAFLGATEFDDVRAGHLTFWGVSFRGPVDFTRARMDELTFQGWMVATEDVLFRYASIGSLKITRMTFAKNADFGGACLNASVILRKVAFKGDARFDDARLPPTPTSDCQADADQKSLSLSEVAFEKGLFLAEKQFFWSSPWWAQWAEHQPVFEQSAEVVDSDEGSTDEPDLKPGPPRATLQDRRQWREIERGFQNAGNLSLQNYALYRRSIMESADETGVGMIGDRADRWFWGYGLRPSRVVGWLAVVVVAFALIYLGQTAGLGAGLTRTSGWWRRIRFAVLFSARTTLQPKYGYQNSTTPLFKTITTVQWFLSVVLLTCLLYAISKTNPLANELIKKLIV